MLEVQAIISRTYAVSHLGTPRERRFRPVLNNALPAVRAAPAADVPMGRSIDSSRRTHAGSILFFDRQPIQALFHADCGGYTSTSSAVWGGIDRPYLVARPDDGAAQGAHATWRFEVIAGRAGRGARADARTRVEPGPRSDRAISRDRDGRADAPMRSRIDRRSGATRVSGRARRRPAPGARAARSAHGPFAARCSRSASGIARL